jgi:sec-independent protein translocase protein TatA
MIPGLPSMGGMELLIILAVVLLFFGAKRLPELGRSLGNGIREFRKGTAGHDDNKEELEERKPKDEEEPSLNGVAHAESSHAEPEATSHTEQKT